MSDGYTITFNMVMAIVFTAGGSILAFAVKKWLADADRAQDAKDKTMHESFQALHGIIKEKDDKAQDAFKLAHMRVDKLRDQRETDMEKVHGLELALVGAVKREEMTELLHRIDASKDEIIKAVLASGK